MNILIDPLAHPVIGHRGMAAVLPENTLEGMKRAFSHGADAVEFDLRLTADGEVVVMHDQTVDRTTDGTGPVASKTLKELRELNAGANFPVEGIYQIPLFSEVIESFSEKHLLIEIKDPAAASPARELIEQFGAQSRCMVDSYHDIALRAFRGSGIPVGAGRDGTAQLLKSFFLLRDAKVEYDGMCVPPRYGNVPLPIRILSRIARKAGKTIHIWTVNGAAEARTLWNAGVNGIISDDVRPILAERART